MNESAADTDFDWRHIDDGMYLKLLAQVEAQKVADEKKALG